MRLSTLTQFAFIATLLIHSDGRTQCISEPAIGESYFANVQTISYQQKVNLQKPELVPLFESPCPQSIFGRKTSPDLSLPIHTDFELWRSQNALRSFVNSSNDIQLPLSFESTRSNFLLARWEGRYPIHRPTKTFPENKLHFIERSADDHVELIWSPLGFQLNFYQDRDNRVRKCPPLPPAVLTETVSLTVHSHQSCLVLRPNKLGILPLFVILSNNGDAQLAMNPIGRIADGQDIDHDNKTMHAKPDLRVPIEAMISVPAR